ncbi:MAG: hydrogenase formation protein HypD [Anaerovoracaceae bacterium]|nr:hydrogenase formation protein HypD [Anaerovoracaceae bacterium]
MDIKDVIDYLKAYDGPELRFMEVCGSHTAAIFKNGIRSLISPKIKLISGPGCPVCVTPTAFIDKCAEYAERDDAELLTYGDMIKVPGTRGSLADLKGEGAHVHMMYSAFEAVEKARKEPEKTFAVAAVGFETTAPAYALMIEEAARQGIENIKVITALKLIVPAIEWICESQPAIDGFILPGHVSTIIGCGPYEGIAEKYHKPMVVSGFEAEHILAVIFELVRQCERGEAKVVNLYRNAVRDEGNVKAQQLMAKCFETGTAVWRGLGAIEDSGLYLTGEYAKYDAGSRGLVKDMELPEGCSCSSVITGKLSPDECPMFGTKCTPLEPYGPCMVSAEGACGIWFRNR